MGDPTYSLDQLASFLAVVDAGSFTAAGRKLGRVQSAVSYGIAQLEDALGARLFDRDGHTPALTVAGHRLAAEARLVLAQARELAECAARLHDGIEPELRVFVDAAYPTDRLVHACAAFRGLFASTALRVDIGQLGDPVEAVRQGAADLAVCNLAWTTPADLAIAYIGTVSLVPVCAAGHALAKQRPPQRASALARETQIVHSERGALTSDQGVLSARTWRVTDLALKLALIRAGVGWGSVPLGLVEPLVARGELVRLTPEQWPPGGHDIWMHAVARKDRMLGRAGQWLRDQLRLDTGPDPMLTRTATRRNRGARTASRRRRSR